MAIIAFYGRKNLLSNFYEDLESWDFIVPDQFSETLSTAYKNKAFTINNSEVSIMLMKAALMGDNKSFLEISQSPSPLVAKKLGRKIRPWNQDIWNSNIEAVALAALRAKFAAGTGAADALLSTVPATLVEASPGDKIWGCGLNCDMVYAAHANGNDDEWINAGRNLLGKSLEIIRFELSQNVGEAPSAAGSADALY